MCLHVLLQGLLISTTHFLDDAVFRLNSGVKKPPANRFYQANIHITLMGYAGLLRIAIDLNKHLLLNSEIRPIFGQDIL